MRFSDLLHFCWHYIRELCLLPISPIVTRIWAVPLLRIPVGTRGNFDQLRNIPTNILILRQDGIGDMILTTPFIRELRRSYPKAHIIIGCCSPAKQALENCPYIDELISLPGNPHRRPKPYKRFIQALRHSRYFRDRNIDLCILPRWSADTYHTTYLAFFSGAKIRVGFGAGDPEREKWNMGYSQLLTHSVSDKRQCHEVLHMQYMLAFLQGTNTEDHLELWPSEEDNKFVLAKLHAQTNTRGYGKTRIALAIGASISPKRWPPDNYVTLINEINRKRSIEWLLIGGNTDQEIAEMVKRKATQEITDMVGSLSICQTAALLKQCDLVISNDSVAVHLAAAVNTPVIVISWRRKKGDLKREDPFSAWGVDSQTVGVESPIPPCQNDCEQSCTHCIATIEPARILTHIDAFLDKNRNLIKKNSI